MKTRISRIELDNLAAKLGMKIQHDCGGFRVVSEDNNTYVFPNGGICPTATARECIIFLKGVKHGMKHFIQIKD